MDVSDITELHYITHVGNLPSIMINGLLSHERARLFAPTSMADEAVQARRRQKVVPGGRPLHHYVNLYIHARNPMLYRLQGRYHEVCVLAVSLEVIRRRDVVITDGNAAADMVRFYAAPDGLNWLDRDLVLAEYWTQGNEFEKHARKVARCAEVLVPDRIGPEHVLRAYVAADEVGEAIRAMGCGLNAVVDPHLFFRQERRE